HEKITQIDGGYSTLMKNIKVIKKQGLNLGISVVISKYNLNEMEKIAETLINKTDNISFVRVIPAGRAKILEKELYLDKKEYKKYIKTLINLREKGIGAGYLKKAETFEFLITNKKNYQMCSAGFTNIGIRSDLIVTPCLALVEYPIGDLKKNSLKEILDSDEIKFFREFPKKDSELYTCKGCKHIDFCRGGCRAHAFYSTEDITAKDPGCLL
ncbi:unnamed protein product, partial [marine sediment metagenome]